MTIPDRIYWKRRTQDKFPQIPIDPTRTKWKRFFLENYARQKLETSTDSNIDSVFEELKAISPYIRHITIMRLPIKISIFKLFCVFRCLKSLKLTYGEPWRNFSQYEDIEHFSVDSSNSVTLRDCQQMCSDFESLGSSCSLEKFDMSQNSLTDQCLLRVAKGLYNSTHTLISLTFAHNAISDKGAHANSSVMLTSPLRKLDRTDNAIRAKGAEKVCACAQRCKTLEELCLDQIKMETQE